MGEVVATCWLLLLGHTLVDVSCLGPCVVLFLVLCRVVVGCVSACLVGRSSHSREWYFGMRVSGFPGCPIQGVIVVQVGLSSLYLLPI